MSYTLYSLTCLLNYVQPINASSILKLQFTFVFCLSKWNHKLKGRHFLSVSWKRLNKFLQILVHFLAVPEKTLLYSQIVPIYKLHKIDSFLWQVAWRTNWRAYDFLKLFKFSFLIWKLNVVRSSVSVLLNVTNALIWIGLFGIWDLFKTTNNSPKQIV